LRYNNLMENRNRKIGKDNLALRIPIWVWLTIILLITVIWKVIWLISGAFPFNSDEAITGIMARHILQGERPIFFYGQSYMGSLDAFLVAGLFSLLGESVLAIRILQVILYSCTIITTALLGRKLTADWATGLLAALLLSVPVVNTTLYTTVTLGGYGETLLLSNIAFLCSMQLISNTDRTTPGKDVLVFGFLGFFSGLGFWVLGLSLVSTIPAVFFASLELWKRRKNLPGGWVTAMLIFILAFILGSFPWWFASLQAGFLTQLKELFGSAIAVENENWVIRSIKHLFYFIFLGLPAALGLRPPWDVKWLALPLLPLIIMIWGWVFWKFPDIYKNETQPTRLGWKMLIMSAGLLMAGFVFTSFGLDPSGRYFLPLVIPLALCISRVVVKAEVPRRIRYAIPVILLVFAAIGTIESAVGSPWITTQFDRVSWIDHHYDDDLIHFLQSNDETRGYSNYWVAYPLAFLTEEKILFVPRLPYHQDLRYTSRDDRIARYTELVDSSPQTAYITTFNPSLDQALREGFTRLGVTWKEKKIGDFLIYYSLSRPVRPAEIQNELTPRMENVK